MVVALHDKGSSQERCPAHAGLRATALQLSLAEAQPAAGAAAPTVSDAENLTRDLDTMQQSRSSAGRRWPEEIASLLSSLFASARPGRPRRWRLCRVESRPSGTAGLRPMAGGAVAPMLRPVASLGRPLSIGQLRSQTSQS